jgi:uncharacterized protein (DUF433 family)
VGLLYLQVHAFRVETFIKYVKVGESMEAFLEGFPSVTREQVLAFLDEATEMIIESVR